MMRLASTALIPLAGGLAFAAACTGESGDESNPSAWAVRAGGESPDERATSISATADGSSFVAGNLRLGSSVFGEGDPNETILEPGNDDAFLARYDPDGSLMWVLREPGHERPYVDVLENGSAFLVGSFDGNQWFGKGGDDPIPLSSAGLGDVFLARYTPTGELVWVVSAGGPDWDRGHAIDASATGGIAIAGHIEEWSQFEETVIEPPSIPAELTPDTDNTIFLASYGLEGDLRWVKAVARYDGNHPDVAVHDDGSVSLFGNYLSYAVFGEGEETQTILTPEDGSDGDLFLAHYAPDGQLLWVRALGAKIHYGNAGQSLAVSDGDSLLAVSPFVGSVRIDTGAGGEEPAEQELVAEGEYDTFVAKYDADGTLLWTKLISGPGYEEAQDVAANEDGGFAVTGTYDFLAHFGAGEPAETSLTADNLLNVFVAKYASDGSLIWARQSGGTAETGGEAVAMTPDGSVFAAGWFCGTASFDVGGVESVTLEAALAEPSDIFVMRLLP